MAVFRDITLNGDDDAVRIRIGASDIRIAEHYEVKVSILQQPSAFTLRLGSNETASKILSLARPNTPFILTVAGRDLQSGVLHARGVPSANYTQIQIKGRDYLAQLFDSFVLEEQTFTQQTYFDLTRKVLDIVGLTEAKGHFLQPLNDLNRQLLTGVTATPRENGDLATDLLTGALSGTGELVYHTPKAKLGTRWFDFLQQQYKLVGLFLWASPDKTFVLGRPHANQPASFHLYRDRAGQSNILDCHFEEDTTMRHSEAIVFGRSGGGKKGVETTRGAFPDDEMLNYGFSKPIAFHDADVKDQQECEYVARRMLSDERRAGWKLEYTVPGHLTPSELAPSGSGTWGPDTVIRVDDEELHVVGDPTLNFHKNFYLEAVTYSRSPQTMTKLSLMRSGDLLFATSLSDDAETKIQRKQNRGGPQAKTLR